MVDDPQADLLHPLCLEDARANGRDRLLALEDVEAMDAAGLVRRCRDEHITMCGVLPTAITMAGR